MSAISTADAMKMVKEKMARNSTTPAQDDEKQETAPSTPTPESTETEPKDSEKGEVDKAEAAKDGDAEQSTEIPGKEGKAPAKPEDKPDETKESQGKDKRPPRQKYTQEERTAHKFAQQKRKVQQMRDQHEQDQKRIKELEDELDRIKGLQPEDFNGKSGIKDYTDYRLHERDLQNEVKSTKERMAREEQEMLDIETQRRIDLSFDTQEEKDEFDDLVRNEGENFFNALQKYDPQGVVLRYLNNVERYPKVLKELMTNMDALRNVFRDGDPDMRRIRLAQLTQELLGEKKPEPATAATIETKPEPQKPSIPVIGRQVTANGAPSEPVHDRKYWNAYLAQHPKG